VLKDPEMRQLGFFQVVDDSLGGTIDTPANPLGFRQPHYEISTLAAYTAHVLEEIGVSDDEMHALAAAGAFGPVEG
jgi:crotonobetainyl-CoA:carnitine CoA-transferase CaiB-like acyl-CoA transferase